MCRPSRRLLLLVVALSTARSATHAPRHEPTSCSARHRQVPLGEALVASLPPLTVGRCHSVLSSVTGPAQCWKLEQRTYATNILYVLVSGGAYVAAEPPPHRQFLIHHSSATLDRPIRGVGAGRNPLGAHSSAWARNFLLSRQTWMSGTPCSVGPLTFQF